MVQLQISLTKFVFALIAIGSVHASQEHLAYPTQDPANISPDGWSSQAEITVKPGIVGQGQLRDPTVPIDDFSSLTEAEFSHMRHPLFPRHSVRIKKSSFCDDTVKSAVTKVENILYILTHAT
jgi:hypothetical protein